MREPVDVPVLIVGGGPVGLLLAVGLRHFGSIAWWPRSTHRRWTSLRGGA